MDLLAQLLNTESLLTVFCLGYFAPKQKSLKPRKRLFKLFLPRTRHLTITRAFCFPSLRETRSSTLRIPHWNFRVPHIDLKNSLFYCIVEKTVVKSLVKRESVTC